MTVAEALEVLKGAATTRRAQTAFEALHTEMDRIGHDDNESSSGKPRFPDANSIAESDKDEGDENERQGRATADTGQGQATARKGS